MFPNASFTVAVNDRADPAVKSVTAPVKTIWLAAPGLTVYDADPVAPSVSATSTVMPVPAVFSVTPPTNVCTPGLLRERVVRRQHRLRVIAREVDRAV